MRPVTRRWWSPAPAATRSVEPRPQRQCAGFPNYIDMAMTGPNNSVQGDYFNSDLSGTEAGDHNGILRCHHFRPDERTRRSEGPELVRVMSSWLASLWAPPGARATRGLSFRATISASTQPAPVGFAFTGISIDEVYSSDSSRDSNTVIGGTSAMARNIVIPSTSTTRRRVD